MCHVLVGNLCKNDSNDRGLGENDIPIGSVFLVLVGGLREVSEGLGEVVERYHFTFLKRIGVDLHGPAYMSPT